MLQDDEAVIMVVQFAEQITPSENYAYKMKYDAIKRQAERIVVSWPQYSRKEEYWRNRRTLWWQCEAGIAVSNQKVELERRYRAWI